MKKVKIFNCTDTDSLEKEINKFLEEFGGRIQETERIMYVLPEPRYIVAIFYTERV